MSGLGGLYEQADANGWGKHAGLTYGEVYQRVRKAPALPPTRDRLASVVVSPGKSIVMEQWRLDLLKDHERRLSASVIRHLKAHRAAVEQLFSMDVGYTANTTARPKLAGVMHAAEMELTRLHKLAYGKDPNDDGKTAY